MVIWSFLRTFSVTAKAKPPTTVATLATLLRAGKSKNRLNSAVRRQRLIAGGVKDQDVDALSKSVAVKTYPVNEKGQEGAEDSGAGFAMVFIIAFLIYMTVLLYGQVVLGAIVEEKETRIAEILFRQCGPSR